MASHHRYHHHQPSPPPTNCYCNPSSYTCCPQPTLLPSPPPPPPPPPQDHHHNHHLLQTIASLLSQQQQFLPTHYPKSHPHKKTFLTETYNNQNQINSTISSLLRRIESLESSLNHHSSSPSSYYSLRDTAARVIQIQFRSFLVRRSKTLRHLKELGFIKSTFNALKSSFSNDTTHSDFVALSQKALDLLLQLDSIEGCDPMVIDGKRSISRDLMQFLDSIERVATKKHLVYVKAVKNVRFRQKVNKPRDSSDDEKRKLLQNLRGRVDKISRLCEVYENGEDSEPEGIHDDDGDDDGLPSVLISRRNGVSADKNVVFMHRQGVQPTAKKSVRFAENGKFFEVHSSNTYEPDLSGDVTCLDGSSSSDDQGEVSENVGDVLDSSQGDEEELVEDGGSRCNRDDGEKNSTMNLRNDGRNAVNGQLPTHREKPIIAAPLPLKMENKADAKRKGVRILP